MRRFRVSLYLSITIALTACGPKGLLNDRQRLQAPHGPGDVGVLLEGSTVKEVENLLYRHPTAQVRILNLEHGLFEIFGLNENQVSAETNRLVQKNVYFQLRPQDPKLSTSFLPTNLKIPGLNPCRSGPHMPEVDLQILGPETLPNGASIEIGRSIKISSKESAPHPQFPKSLRRALIIASPPSSANREIVINAEEYVFQPDALGAYQAIAVIQDSRDVCALTSKQFVATANRPFVGAKTHKVKIDLQRIPHLSSVEAHASWALSEGEGVTIAIIDSGVNYNHPLLAPNLAINNQEIEGNGIDDDGNGLIDDVLGYDFVNSDPFPFDDDGHGTHVAGLAAARQFGLARKSKILAVKALGSLGGDIGTVAAAILYAVDRDAKVINLSLGAPMENPHPALVNAANYAEAKGALLVAAAGNGDPATGLGYNIDLIPVYPASLQNQNVIGVGSSEASSALAAYSNFGSHSVEVIAPGGNMPSDPMFSTAFENPKGALMIAMSGTSMATPIVSGIIAQAISINPNLSTTEIREILLQAGRSIEDLKNISVSGRHLSALATTKMARERLKIF